MSGSQKSSVQTEPVTDKAVPASLSVAASMTAESQTPRSLALRYGMAVVSVIVMLLLRMALDRALHTSFPFITYFVAVAFSAWFGGFGPGILAIVLSALLAMSYLTSPGFSPAIQPSIQLYALVVFALVGLAISGIGETQRRAQARAELSAAEARRTAALLQEEQERLRLAHQAVGVGTWDWNILTNEARWSPEYYELYGLNSATDLASYATWLKAVIPEDRAEADATVQKCLEQNTDYRCEHRVQHPTKGTRWILGLGKTIRDAKQKPVRMIGIGLDITESKRQTEEIEHLNERLSRAMRETHHRVKNNLQIIAAMLELQTLDQPEMIPASEFTRLSRHIKALAAVHDLLTMQAKDGMLSETISARAILQRLLGMLDQAEDDHALQFALDDLPLTSRQATSLALVTNELVANAIKHGGQNGPIEVAFRVQEDCARLEVADSGPGFPPGFKPLEAANTGLELVENLSSWDLNGTTRYENKLDGGGRVTLTIPHTAER